MFDEKATSLMVYSFVDKAGGMLNYTKLIKLLYLTDRKLLEKNEAPMSGEIYVAMPL